MSHSKIEDLPSSDEQSAQTILVQLQVPRSGRWTSLLAAYRKAGSTYTLITIPEVEEQGVDY